ncbi:threonine ammonia-lyase [Magnetovibrio blakemorei]|uniref:Threonine ammonia-lyase n=1 Tax=Magnetovibrio blakemorei TaxID=28181 RepID=A0A1E5Q485_9PROT|nr:threonine ammonia-lyase [Magnetovibrio blakemorei]OEJ64685.1 threonine ammonia-lyase [Magnetovibrio blakemorei]
MNVTFADIQAAHALIKDRVLRTPCFPAARLSELTGANVVLKLENLQHTGAFKVRGALVKLLSLTAEERTAGVIAASAGNHAQGVGYFARQLDIPATIVMPKNTPFTKIARTEALGAKVVLHGEGFIQARDYALELSARDGYIFVHPYDDPLVIAGQGCIGLEMMEDQPQLDCIIAAIGGGGLISGIAIAAKHIKPSVEVFGVQADTFPSMYDAYHNLTTDALYGQTIADGIAVKTPAANTQAIIEKMVDDVFLVSELEIEKALQAYLELKRIVVEGAGAAPLAALIHNKNRFKDRNVGLVVSGGNIDSRMLSTILMRGLAREGRLVSLRIKIMDMPGVLSEVSKVIGNSGANIIEVHHQRLFSDIPLKQTEMDVAVETLDRKHVEDLVKVLCKAGFETRVLSATSE